MFRANAGHQCVTMSLCALIYHEMKGINTGNDLIKIMHVGNKLYSSLSQLARQSFLMLTKFLKLLGFLLGWFVGLSGYQIISTSTLPDIHFAFGKQLLSTFSTVHNN